MELKIIKKGGEGTLKQGWAQTADYADRCGADESHLMLFNRDAGVSWEERLWRREEVVGERRIHIWGA